MARPSWLLVALFLAPSLAFADAEADWKRITELDAGPRIQARTRDELVAAVRDHLARQEAALRTFIAANPGDTRAFEARVRLGRLLLMRGEREHSDKMRAEGQRIFDELEKTATPTQRAELDFARVAALMRSMPSPTREQRDQLHAAARRFQSAHPGDRRTAAVLAEIATLFDTQPKTKREILEDARTLATDEETRRRIADDLRRLDLLGHPLPLRFSTPEGKAIDIADYRGKVVILVFFANWSPPSKTAVASVQRALGAVPKDRVQALAVSLDEKPGDLAASRQELGFNWPVAFDGKGWDSPLVRSLGINALPTAWLVDKAGRLRSLIALESTEAQVRQLLNE